MYRQMMFNLLDSHDTGAFGYCQGDVQLVKSALALSFYKGTPCFYYGTELNSLEGRAPDCRRVSCLGLR